MCTVIVPAALSAVESQVENSILGDEVKGKKRKISLSTCGVCGSEEAKYRCPACLNQSCSLLCVKKHKEDSGCSGVRNKTAFVALSHFDEISLLNDYRFLEDTGRFADGATRDSLIRAPHAYSTSLTTRMLVAKARKMNITLRFLPSTFTKSRENSTYFLKKQTQFLWHLKLIFPQSSTEFIQKRVPDTETLQQILTHYIHPTESDPVIRQKLKMYVHAPSDQVKVFMKAERRKANCVRYHELDMEKSLRDNLRYKILIEYPVLHVVLREHWQDYPLKGPAELSSCNTKRQGADQEMKKVTQVPTSPPQSYTPRGTCVSSQSQESSPEIKPPKEKRAKRETGEEEPEEGEIIDDSDEEDEEGNVKEDPRVIQSCTGGEGTKVHTNVVTAVKANRDELADSVGNDDDDDTGVGGGDQCLNQHVTGSADADS